MSKKEPKFAEGQEVLLPSGVPGKITSVIETEAGDFTYNVVHAAITAADEADLEAKA